MARLLMGAIVTKAVGKIGGQCFRIKNQTQILQRNPNPFKNRAINKNAAMFYIRYVFSSWKNQTEEARATWAEIASNNPQPNRFGDMVNLSARDYYNQANINTFYTFGELVNENTYTATVPFFNFSSVTIDTTENAIRMNDIQFYDTSRAVIYIRRVNSGAINPIASSLPFVTTIYVDDYNVNDLYDACEAFGIQFEAGSWYSFGARLISEWGVWSPMIQYTVQAIGY